MMIKISIIFNIIWNQWRIFFVLITVTQNKYSGPSIVEGFDARTFWNSKKNSRKIRFETLRFETRIKIRKSKHERGTAQHRAAYATVSQQIRTQLVGLRISSSSYPVISV